MMTQPRAARRSRDFFLEHAYAEGGGTNVVNVILVDFRGFDTLGEITVLGIVALTVFALLRRFRPAPESIETPEQQRIQNALRRCRARTASSATRCATICWCPSVIMQWMFPVIIVLAAYLFLRGHDLPGGGFVAGLALAIGFLLQYLAGGTRWVEDRLRILPVRWMGVGLLLAAADRDGSLVVRLSVPDLAFPVCRAAADRQSARGDRLLFDLGVFALVRRRHGADPDRARAPVDPQRSRARQPRRTTRLEERA